MHKRYSINWERSLLVLVIFLNIIILLLLFRSIKLQTEVINLTPLPTPQVKYVYNTLTISEEPPISYTPRPTKTPIVKPKPTIEPLITPTEKPSQEDIINGYIKDICKEYEIEPELIQSIVWHESRYNPKVKNGKCLGLMQIHTSYHSDRAKKLGVKDFYDPYGNILLGVDYISELFNKYEHPKLVLMLYNMKHSTAFSLYKEGKTSKYAKSVLARAERLK